MSNKINRSAFTLIELMAIIVILGFLMILLIPKINSVYGDSKKSIYYESTKSLIKSFEEYYVLVRISNNFEGCSYNFSTGLNTCSNFSFEGQKPADGELSLSSDGSINGSVIFDKYSFIIDDGIILLDED